MSKNNTPTFLKFKESEVIERMDKSAYWEERHRQINYRLDVAEKRLDNHSKRLDKIELANGRLEERLNSLLTQLENLNKTMKWFITVIVGAFISFFFYVVQQRLFM